MGWGQNYFIILLFTKATSDIQIEKMPLTRNKMISRVVIHFPELMLFLFIWKLKLVRITLSCL